MFFVKCPFRSSGMVFLSEEHAFELLGMTSTQIWPFQKHKSSAYTRLMLKGKKRGNHGKMDETASFFSPLSSATRNEGKSGEYIIRFRPFEY